MSRRGFQNRSYLPVDRAIRAIDAICAKHPRKGWDDQLVRREIHKAAVGRMIEIGAAKRILHSSLPENTLPQGIVDERLRRRRRIVEAARRLTKEGLETLAQNHSVREKRPKEAAIGACLPRCIG